MKAVTKKSRAIIFIYFSFNTLALCGGTDLSSNLGTFGGLDYEEMHQGRSPRQNHNPAPEVPPEPVAVSKMAEPDLPIRILLLSRRDREMTEEQRIHNDYIETIKAIWSSEDIQTSHYLSVLYGQAEMSFFVILALEKAITKIEDVREAAPQVSGDLVEKYSAQLKLLLKKVELVLASTSDVQIPTEAEDKFQKITLQLAMKIAQEKTNPRDIVSARMKAVNLQVGLKEQLGQILKIQLLITNNSEFKNNVLMFFGVDSSTVMNENLSDLRQKLRENRSLIPAAKVYADLENFRVSRDLRDMVFRNLVVPR